MSEEKMWECPACGATFTQEEKEASDSKCPECGEELKEMTEEEGEKPWEEETDIEEEWEEEV